MKFERPLPSFFSYTQRDRKHLEELIYAIAELRVNGVVDKWDDRDLRGGQDWERVLMERARKSRLFLLLITNKFINSDYCIASELHIARTLYEKRQAAIAPVEVETCNWRIDGLRDLNLIRPFDKPVNSSRKDRAWTEVGLAVKKIADALFNGTYFTQEDREVPVMLPYSIGRDGEGEEEQQFETALAAAPGHRPFVFILSGHRQGQNQFIDRLAREQGPIRRQFGLKSAYNPIAVEGNLWIGSGQAPETMLDTILAPLVEPPPDSADRASIAAALKKNPGATIVRFELSAAQWTACGNSRLNDFLQYWNEWPALQPDRPLLVFVSVNADLPPRPLTGGFWLALESISQTAVEAWLVKPQIRSQFAHARISAELPHIFESADRLRAEELADKLLPVLRKYQI